MHKPPRKEFQFMWGEDQVTNIDSLILGEIHYFFQPIPFSNLTIPLMSRNKPNPMNPKAIK